MNSDPLTEEETEGNRNREDASMLKHPGKPKLMNLVEVKTKPWKTGMRTSVCDGNVSLFKKDKKKTKK